MSDNPIEMCSGLVILLSVYVSGRCDLSFIVTEGLRNVNPPPRHSHPQIAIPYV